MTQTLHVLSGGAANGLVSRLQPRLSALCGLEIAGTFSAVGQMKDALLAGQPCDVVILTQALIRQLGASGHIDEASMRPIGQVHTGLGVPRGQPAPTVQTPAQLAEVLRQADGIYMPDGLKSTAGIHFMKVLRELGLQDHAHLHRFANGQTAMAAMAEQAAGPTGPGLRLIGCTQVTEILNTPGVQLIGLLPAPFELATPYWAAMSKSARQPEAAALLIDLLSSPEQAGLRRDCGFS